MLVWKEIRLRVGRARYVGTSFYLLKANNDEPTKQHNAELLNVTTGSTYRYFQNDKTSVRHWQPKQQSVLRLAVGQMTNFRIPPRASTFLYATHVPYLEHRLKEFGGKIL
jgi:hypothetical protein